MLEQIPARGSGYASFDARAWNPGFKNRWLFKSFLRSGASDEIRPESEQGSLQSNVNIQNIFSKSCRLFVVRGTAVAAVIAYHKQDTSRLATANASPPMKSDGR